MAVLCQAIEARIKARCPSVNTVGVAMDMDEIREQKTGLPGVSVYWTGESGKSESETQAEHQRMMSMYGLQILVKPADLVQVMAELRAAMKGWAAEVEGHVFESFELHSTEIRDSTGVYYWYEQVWRVPEYLWPDPTVNQ